MIYFLLFIFLTGLGLYFLNLFLREIQPDALELEEDKKNLKAEIEIFEGGLVSIENYLSLDDLDFAIDKDGNRRGKGVFQDISGAPMLAFSFKKYKGNIPRKLVYIKTNEGNFFLYSNARGTEVMVENKKIGIIRKGSSYFGIKNNLLFESNQKENNRIEIIDSVARKYMEVKNKTDVASSNAVEILEKNQEALLLGIHLILLQEIDRI